MSPINVAFFLSLILGSVFANVLPIDGVVETPDASAGNDISFLRDIQKIRYLEEKLREDIDREIQDLVALEHELVSNLGTIQRKKQQLEAKKRQPFQCLVNVVSCWKK